MIFTNIELSILKYILEYTDEKYLDGKMAPPCYDIFITYFENEYTEAEIKDAINNLLEKSVLKMYGLHNYLSLQFSFEISKDFGKLRERLFKY